VPSILHDQYRTVCRLDFWLGPTCERLTVSISRPLVPSNRAKLVEIGWSPSGHSTKSLRDSPLRGGKSREAVASREESDSESTRSPHGQAHLLDLRPVSDAARDIGPTAGMTKMALTNSAKQVA
jgi:hypothetical protein